MLIKASVSPANISERARQSLADGLNSYRFMLVLMIFGVLNLALGTLLQLSFPP